MWQREAQAQIPTGHTAAWSIRCRPPGRGWQPQLLVACKRHPSRGRTGWEPRRCWTREPGMYPGCQAHPPLETVGFQSFSTLWWASEPVRCCTPPQGVQGSVTMSLSPGLPTLHHSGPHLLCHLHHSCRQILRWGFQSSRGEWLPLPWEGGVQRCPPQAHPTLPKAPYALWDTCLASGAYLVLA